MHITRVLEDQCLTFKLAGRFTFADNDAFQSVISEIAGHSAMRFVLDLSELEFVDSAGLGMLLLAHDAAAQNHKKPMTLHGAAGQVRKMFSIARFDQYFTMS